MPNENQETSNNEGKTGSNREQFLLQMYSAFWDCISRAEDSAWKVIAAYIALFVGLHFLYQIIGPAGVATIFIIFSFTAVVFALRANLWFIRNMGLISNLEKEFLRKEDYEVLIPKSFAENVKMPFLNWEIWIIQAISYFGICIAFLLYIFPKIEICEHKIIVSSVFAASLLFTIFCGWHYQKELRDFSKHAPGRKLAE